MPIILAGEILTYELQATRTKDMEASKDYRL
jgi:hypothetical protein